MFSITIIFLIGFLGGAVFWGIQLVTGFIVLKVRMRRQRKIFNLLKQDLERTFKSVSVEEYRNLKTGADDSEETSRHIIN